MKAINDYKDKVAETFQRYPVICSTVVVVVLALVVFLLTRHHQEQNIEEENDVKVADTLALNIICTPTLESLPFYHAVESGLCDSLHLALGIVTEKSQFDIDSIMRRTKRIDGAVLDSHRLEYYRKAKKSLSVTEAIHLYGIWQLVTSEKLRLRETSQLKKRTVATARFATSSYLLEQSLRGTTLKPSDLYHAQINDFELRALMLDEAQVDASLLPEPFATRALMNGHKSVWKNDSISSLVLCFRNNVYKDERKQVQIELLKQVYNLSVLDLNVRGAHAADSALIKSFRLKPEVIDTIKLPRYRPI